MENHPHRALEGLQVVELCDEKVSFCGKLLADMGARVILVEKPPQAALPAQKEGRSRFFAYHHARKQSITLDVEHPQGRSLFLRLISQSDVVLHGLSPAKLAELSLDYEILRRKNPGLIMVSLSGFGHDGPRRNWQSCDLVAAATGGWMYVTGSPLREPLQPPGNQSFQLASLYGAVGVLLAVRQKRMTQQGAHLDLSLQECVASSLDHVLPRYLREEEIPGRVGGSNWNHSFFVVPCRDGYIHLAPFQQWETLVEWMDSEDMADDLTDEKFLAPDYRLEHLDHIMAIIEGWARTHSREELFQTARLMRFAWAPVCTPSEVLASPQLAARGFFEHLPSGEAKGSRLSPGPAFHSEGAPPPPGPKAPCQGQDNLKIYRDGMGLSSSELQELQAQGVI
ncbi:MAG: CoA transferase [Desulfarculaceae bacterium]|jgi:benzylsuccinate CoA-transferase BbsE subunit